MKMVFGLLMLRRLLGDRSVVLVSILLGSRWGCRLFFCSFQLILFKLYDRWNKSDVHLKDFSMLLKPLSCIIHLRRLGTDYVPEP